MTAKQTHQLSDLELATARAKYIESVFLRDPVPSSYERLTIEELKTHALAKLGYSHTGVASVLDVGVGTASRYYRRVGRVMGYQALEAAHPDVIDRWPRGPVCVLGTRHAATDAHRRATDGFDRWETDRRGGGLRYICPHGNVPKLTQSPSKRLSVSYDGVDMDPDDRDSCDCVDPLVVDRWY